MSSAAAKNSRWWRSLISMGIARSCTAGVPGAGPPAALPLTGPGTWYPVKIPFAQAFALFFARQSWSVSADLSVDTSVHSVATTIFTGGGSSTTTTNATDALTATTSDDTLTLPFGVGYTDVPHGAPLYSFQGSFHRSVSVPPYTTRPGSSCLPDAGSRLVIPPVVSAGFSISTNTTTQFHSLASTPSRGGSIGGTQQQDASITGLTTTSANIHVVDTDASGVVYENAYIGGPTSTNALITIQLGLFLDQLGDHYTPFAIRDETALANEVWLGVSVTGSINGGGTAYAGGQFSSCIASAYAAYAGDGDPTLDPEQWETCGISCVFDGLSIPLYMPKQTLSSDVTTTVGTAPTTDVVTTETSVTNTVDGTITITTSNNDPS